MQRGKVLLKVYILYIHIYFTCSKMSKSSSNSVDQPSDNNVHSSMAALELNVGTVFLERIPALTSGGQGCDSLQTEQCKQRARHIKL